MKNLLAANDVGGVDQAAVCRDSRSCATPRAGSD